MELSGFDDFEKKLDEIKKKYPNKKAKFLKQEAETLKRYTKDNTPKDTGKLVNAWERTQPKGDIVKVYNNTEYAAHVEYGHRVKSRKTGKVVAGKKMLHKGLETLKSNYADDAEAILEELFE